MRALIGALTLGLLGVVAVTAQITRDRSEVSSSGPIFDEVNRALQEIYWRARANDNTVFYENEFHTLRLQMSIDEYLTGVRFKVPREPNSDSATGVRLDSVEVFGDTILTAHMTSIVGGGSDGAAQREYYRPRGFYRDQGRWIMPLSTTPAHRDEYYRSLRSYERAAEREAQRDKQDSNK